MAVPLQEIALAAFVLAVLTAAVVKGSRAPQPLTPTKAAPTKTAMYAVAVAPICAAISYAAFQLLKHVGDRVTYGAPKKPSFVVVVLLFSSVILPWFVGAYFALAVARARNVLLRVIGALEFAVCLCFGLFYLFAVTVGFR
jgi:hypothetical protein